MAFVLAGLGAGGAERVIAILSRALIAQGWRVTVITFDAPDDPVYHDFAPEVQLHRLNVPMGGGRRSLKQAARRVAALRRVIREGGVDIVVSFLTKINVITLLAVRGLKVPVIVSERNNPLQQRASPVWRALLALLYPRASAIVMQTERSKACLPSRQRERALVIPNPIVLPQGLPVPSDECTITAVGRLEEQKGFDMLMDAFGVIAPSHPDWRLRIWGDGPLRRELGEKAKQLGLADRVELAGRSGTAGGWINPAGVFVLSSRYEGFPNALAEAMAAGMAVVAFDCDFGPRELIRSGVDGYLVPPGDVRGLAQILAKLMSDSQERQQLSTNGTLSAGQWKPGIICSKWVDLLDAIEAKL